MVIIVSGVSGVGKNTIIQKLIDQYDNMFFIKSATTRPRRNDNDLYEYRSDEEFFAQDKAGEFFETIYLPTHGQWSATQYKELDKIVNNPQNIYIKDIEVKGTRKLRKYFKGKTKMISIFLDAPDDVLYNRLLQRGEIPEKAKSRLSRGTMERKYKKEYDLVIENIDMQKTINTIKEFISKQGE